MNHPNYLLLYVENPEASGRFYADLLGATPVESSPTFVLFALKTGLMLGLWSKHTVAPAPQAAAGGAEIGLRVANDDEVNGAYADWTTRGVRIAQEPTRQEFGLNFLALDPDGHRLRVYALSDAA